MKRNYYIYYRTHEPAERVRAAVAAMLPALARETGVQGRLLRRSEDATTWMEVYEGVTDCAAFERALAAAVERHDLRQLLAPGTQRHVECFIEA